MCIRDSRLAVLILRGSVRDGEVARVELEDGHIVVLPNHGDSDGASDEDDDIEMSDDDAMEELEDRRREQDLYDD